MKAIIKIFRAALITGTVFLIWLPLKIIEWPITKTYWVTLKIYYKCEWKKLNQKQKVIILYATKAIQIKYYENKTEHTVEQAADNWTAINRIITECPVYEQMTLNELNLEFLKDLHAGEWWPANLSDIRYDAYRLKQGFNESLFFYKYILTKFKKNPQTFRQKRGVGAPMRLLF